MTNQRTPDEVAYWGKYNNAIEREIDFDLTLEDYIKLHQKKRCYYTGALLNNKPKSAYRITLERIDSNVGYTPANTVAVAHAANRFKNRALEEPNRSRLTLWEITRMIAKLWLIGYNDNRPRNMR